MKIHAAILTREIVFSFHDRGSVYSMNRTIRSIYIKFLGVTEQVSPRCISDAARHTEGSLSEATNITALIRVICKSHLSDHIRTI